MTTALDRTTAFSAVGGALAGAKNYTPVAAVGITVGLELWENYRRCGSVEPDDAKRFVANIGVGLAAWWLVRELSK